MSHTLLIRDFYNWRTVFIANLSFICNAYCTSRFPSLLNTEHDFNLNPSLNSNIGLYDLDYSNKIFCSVKCGKSKIMKCKYFNLWTNSTGRVKLIYTYIQHVLVFNFEKTKFLNVSELRSILHPAPRATLFLGGGRG